jgi:hypothetical protein
MVCVIIKRGQEGEKDKSIEFVVLKSRTESFVDARQAIFHQCVPTRATCYVSRSCEARNIVTTDAGVYVM